MPHCILIFNCYSCHSHVYFFILLFIGPHLIIPSGKGFSGNATIQCLTPQIFAKILKTQIQLLEYPFPPVLFNLLKEKIHFAIWRNTFCKRWLLKMRWGVLNRSWLHSIWEERVGWDSSCLLLYPVETSLYCSIQWKLWREIQFCSFTATKLCKFNNTSWSWNSNHLSICSPEFCFQWSVEM